MKKNRNKKRLHKRAAAASGLQIRTTIDFGEQGVPLEKFDEIMRTLRQRHLDVASKAPTGFVPIPFARYVDLHVQNNPSVDRNEFVSRLREAVDARKAGARCACGALIWAIGSAETGAACFTCITGEAWPDADYEIDEDLGLHRYRLNRSGSVRSFEGTIDTFGAGNWNLQIVPSGLRIPVDEAKPSGAPISRRAGNRCQLLIQARPVCIRPSQSAIAASIGGVVAITTPTPGWRGLMSRT